MKLKILSWNVRGLNDEKETKNNEVSYQNEKSRLSVFVRNQGAQDDPELGQELRIGGFLGWGAMEARGGAGCVVVFLG